MKTILSHHSKIISLLILFTVAFLAISLTISFPLLSAGNSLDKKATFAGKSCPPRPFTSSPVQLSEITTITPRGHLFPPLHVTPVSHVYLNFANRGDNATPPETIYSPTNITISTISVLGLLHNPSSNRSYYDYSLQFSACSSLLQGYFIHIVSLFKALQTAFNSTTSEINSTIDYSGYSDTSNNLNANYVRQVSVNASAGSILGTAGGDPVLCCGVDFGLSDLRFNATVADNSLWAPHDNHAVCPLDYFTANISSYMYSRIGGEASNGSSVIFPPSYRNCGQVYQDVAGTAKGLWLSENASLDGCADHCLPTNEPYELSLVENNVNFTQGLVGFGLGVQKSLGTSTITAYIFNYGSSSNFSRVNVPFNKVVADGNIYCYQTTMQYGTESYVFVLELLNSTTLRMGSLSGPACNSGSWYFASSQSLFLKR